MEEEVRTELNDNLAKVIRMPRPAPKPTVAYSSAALLLHTTILSKAKLVDIAHTLHDEPQCKEHNTGNVPACPKGYKWVGRHIGRVDDRHRQRDDPHPEHLEDPKPKKGEELVALVIEAVVFSRFEDAEEEEAREAGAPEHDEDGGDDLAGVWVGAG